METKAFHASISLIFKIFARAELIVCRWIFSSRKTYLLNLCFEQLDEIFHKFNVSSL